LVLVAYVTGYAAYFTDANSDPGTWGTPPLIVGATLASRSSGDPGMCRACPSYGSPRSFPWIALVLATRAWFGHDRLVPSRSAG
jgi:hypothetical protein